MKNKKLLVVILLIVLLVNISTVYSSWYDWSRYEEGKYSFKIPEGFETKYHELSGQTYLSSDIGTIDIHFGSEIGIKAVEEHEFYSNTKKILQYNDTTSFYTTTITNKYNNTKSYSTTGALKINNETYLQITMVPSNQLSESDYNKTIERDINIIKGMLESMEINKN